MIKLQRTRSSPWAFVKLLLNIHHSYCGHCQEQTFPIL